LQGNFIITSELAFQDAINAPGFLLSAQLAVVVRFSTMAELCAFSVLSWGISAVLDGALRGEAPFPFEEQLLTFTPAEFTYRPTIF
jgi:hypothetical protein